MNAAHTGADTVALHWSGLPAEFRGELAWSLSRRASASEAQDAVVLPEAAVVVDAFDGDGEWAPGSGSVTATGLDLEHGTVLFARLVAARSDGAGAAMSLTVATTVDAPELPDKASESTLIVTPGSAQQVEDALVVAASDAEGFTIAWPDVPLGSSGVEFSVSIGFVEGNDGILGWSEATTSRSMHIDAAAIRASLLMQNGEVGVANVRVLNRGGDAVGMHSQAFIMDGAPPFDVFAALMDRALSEDDSVLRCSWSMDDVDSGIAYVRAGFGTLPSATDVSPFEQLGGNVTFHSVDGIDLVAGESYHCVVRVMDFAGFITESSSPALIVYNEPPTTGHVFDGDVLGVDADIQASTDAIHVSWSGFVGAGSTVERAEWGVGTSAGADDVLPFTLVDIAVGSSSAPAVDLATALETGTTYYSTIRAFSSSGAEASASSDGIVPVPGAVEDINGEATGPLEVRAIVAHVPSVPSTSADWCECEDANAAFSATTGACSCSPGYYLDAWSGACVTCGLGTCKHSFGNAASLCTAADCVGGVDEVAEAPVDASALSPCVDELPLDLPGTTDVSDVVSFVETAGGQCVCPPGSRLAQIGDVSVCLKCAAGSYSPSPSDDPVCTPCWKSSDPDVVLAVEWSAAAVGTLGAGDEASVLVEVGADPASPGHSISVATDDSSVLLASTDAEHQPTQLVHGVSTYVRVAVLDADGDTLAQEWVTAFPGYLDLSPPVAGIVSDGGSLTDSPIVPSTEAATVSWAGFSDVESGIAAAEVALGTSPGATDLSEGFVSASSDMSHTFEGLALSTDEEVFATVRVRNGAGAWTVAQSDGATVQPDLPDGSVVVRGPATTDAAFRLGDHDFDHEDDFPYQHVSVLPSSHSVRVSWSFDAVSGAGLGELSYVWALFKWDAELGDVGERATNYSSPTLLTTGEMDGLDLAVGDTFVVVVTASNDAGVSVESRSPPVEVDPTPPAEGVLHITVQPAEGVDPERVVIDRSSVVRGGFGVRLFTARTDTLGFEWEFTDNETAIEEVIVAAGAVQGGVDGVAATVVSHEGGDGDAEFTDLQLHHGACYSGSVFSRNAAGLRSALTHSQETACIDITPPAVSMELRNANGNESAYPGLTDAELAIAATPIGLRAAALASRADDLLVLQSVHSLEVTAHIEDTQSGHCCLTWSISLSDDPSDEALPGFEYEVWQSDYGLGVDGRFRVNMTLEELPAGELLFIHLSGYNGAGLPSGTATSPLFIDSTPPEGSITVPRAFSLDDIDSQGRVHMLVHWEFSDDETDVVGYILSATVSVSGGDPSVAAEPRWVDRRSAAMVFDDVQSDSLYNVSVKACNAAGLCGGAFGATVLDTTPPVAGVVYVGPPDEDAVVEEYCVQRPCTPPEPALIRRDEFLDLQVSWGGFKDDESEIIAYELNVGYVDGGPQLGGPISVDDETFTSDIRELAGDDAVFAPVWGDAVYVTVTAVTSVGRRVTESGLVARVDVRTPLSAPVTFVGTEDAAPPMHFATLDRAGVPVPDVVAGLGVAESLSPMVQEDLTAATIEWEAFEDDIELDHYNVQLLTITKDENGAPAALEEVVSVLDVSPDTLSFTFETTLVAGAAYTARVTGVDGAGNAATTTTRRQLVPDVTPPVLAGTVRDGLDAGRDSNCQPHANVSPEDWSPTIVHADAEPLIGSTDSGIDGVDLADVTLSAYARVSVLTAHWNPFRDEQSGVAEVEAALGTSPGSDDLVAFADVPGAAVNVQFVVPRLEEGAVVYVSVRARNALGQWSNVASSDGVRMLCAAGSIGCDYDGTFLCVAGQIVQAAALE